jgi:osmotically-inducible protein OsmY
MREETMRICIDDNIANRVIEALWNDPYAPAEEISVHVLGGTVMLTGEVATEAQRIAVGRLVADLMCVERFTNALTVAEVIKRFAA